MSSLGMSAAGRSPCSAWKRVVPLAAPGALLSPPQTCRTGTAPAWRYAMTPPPERDQLFISYSHVDRGWVERLQMRYLTPA